jgi:cytochrome b561
LATRLQASRDDVYDGLTIAFHWATALVVLSLFVLALFPGVIKGAIVLHKTLGLLVLVLVGLRIVWRLFSAAGRRLRRLSRSWCASAPRVRIWRCTAC